MERSSSSSTTAYCAASQDPHCNHDRRSPLRLAFYTCLFSLLGPSCSASDANATNPISDPQAEVPKRVDLVHIGLSMEVPDSYKLITSANLDSLKQVVRGLAKLQSPCDGSLTNVQDLVKNQNMQMLVDRKNARNTVVAARHPKVSFTKEQASSAIASICGKLFFGFSMTRVSESSGMLPVGVYYKAKFFIEGPEWDYVSTTYIVTSKLRTYTITFNGDGIKDQLGVLGSLKESATAIEASVDWSEYLSRVNPSFQKALVDSAMFYLYQSGQDTSGSEAGSVVTIPQCCLFTLPEGTEIQSASYQKYSQAVIRTVGRNDRGTFWLQQEGINQGKRDAFKTYFRFTIAREVLPIEDRDIVMANFSKADLEYLKTTYEAGIRAAMLPSQQLESIQEPVEFKFGPYFGVRLGHTRNYDGKRTIGTRMIVTASGNRYIIEAAYRLEHKEHWEAVVSQLLNSLVLL